MNQATLRVEDGPLLRGTASFSDDLHIDGQLHAVFVRSVHAHARITAIDIGPALAPGIVAVLTADDIHKAGVGTVSRPPPQNGLDGSALIVPHRPALATERVVHIGEAVALVVAESLALARDAADRVVVDYEPLPVVTDATAALAAGAPVVWPEVGNLALDWMIPTPASAAEVDAVLAAAPHAVRITVVNQRLAGVPLEPRGATALFDPSSGRYVLHAPSQAAHSLKAALVAIMGLQPSHLQVLSGHVGGAFGLKTPAYPEHPALLVAAKLTGRPVHWMATRSESFLCDHQGRDNVTEAALALDEDGRFLALKATAVTNLCAYVASSGAIIATNGFANCFPAQYAIPKVSVGVRLAFTHTVPTGAYRGAGRPEANYVIERLIDTAARQLGIDRIELRRRNQVAPAAMPFRNAIGTTYDSGDFAAAMEKAADLAHLASFGERRADSEQRGKRRGIGVSCFLEHAGGGPTEGAVLEFVGGTLVLRLGMHASGQGHATVFRNLLARPLGIAPDGIAVEQGDSELPIRGGPAVGSRSTNAAGAAIVVGAAKLVATARAEAATLLEAAPESVSYDSGFFDVAGTNRRISLFALAEELARAGAAARLATVVQADATSTYPNGCHIAEVEVDPDTGNVAVVGYTAVDDCGVVLDHTLAEAQIVGGLAQGFGQALMERIVYDETGQLLSGSLADYAMPRAEDMPPIVSAFHEVPCRTNELGVKGIGEAGPSASIGAIMNAIADAIPGVQIDMPATPEKIWRACREKSSA
ncbi:xanthine dehydrogenase family protein molybdopterin-binding subunit [soil metagenome]